MRRSIGSGALTALACTLALLQATPAAAQLVIDSVTSAVLLGSASGSHTTTVSDASDIPADRKSFTLRFGLNVSADPGLLEPVVNETGLGLYTTDFLVGSSGNYDLTVTVRRSGELQRFGFSQLGCDNGSSLDVAEVGAPSVTLNGQAGPPLDLLTLPAVSLNDGPGLESGDKLKALPDGMASQTLELRNRPSPDFFGLAFSMQAALQHNGFACPVVARLGAQTGTPGCTRCSYPGEPARDVGLDGLFVEVTLTDLCGNGGSNPGEECDLANLNGMPGSCCTFDCKLREQGEICRPAAGMCDAPEQCSGNSPSCPADAKRSSNEVCRAAAGDCDVAERCSGESNDCLADARRTGQVCRAADPAAGGCDLAEVCGAGVACPADGKLGNGQPCNDGVFCNGTDSCSTGQCSVHGGTPCQPTQSCSEFGEVCLEKPPLVVTNADGDGSEGSLGNVIAAANLRAGADVIAFDPEFFSVPRRITLTSALPDITGGLTMLGPGANMLTVDAGQLGRVFSVGNGVTAEIHDMTITGGNAGAAAGGGILNGGALTVEGCHITGNTAAFGGGISSGLGATLAVEKSTISNNTATGNSSGGGIAAVEVTVTNSTISGNRATGSGGDNGGGLRVSSATIENSTIANNFAVGPSRAGGLRINVGTATLRNTIVAANTPDTPDVSSSAGTLSSGGFNLIGNPGPLSVNGPNDQKGTPAEPIDPLLLPLTDNGGGSPTHALRLTSPALDRGSRFGASADERERTRPFDVAGIAGPGDQSDIGAVEMQAAIVTNAADSGAGSLRQAIDAGQANDDILFDPAFFRVPRRIALGSEILISHSLAMHGPGAHLLSLSGQNRNRVFRVTAGGLHVAISGATLRDGNSGIDAGGAVRSHSNLALSRCAVVASRAGGSAGGVYVRHAVATFTDCTLSGNTAQVRGGAVELDGSTASFTNCTVSGNTAALDGGGISVFDTFGDRMLAITNSTIVNNAGTASGGIRLEGAEDLPSAMTVRGSIIADNTGASIAKASVGGPITITSLGHNLASDDGGGFLADDTDQTGTDPKLGPLQYNGGPTQTHAPLPGSPALDQGDSAGGIADQRGRTRRFDVDGVAAVPGGDNSDVGAVEAHPVIVTNTNNDGPNSLRAAVTNAPPDTDVWFDPVFFASERAILLSSEILVGEAQTIQGPAAKLVITGRALGRVFNIASGAPVAMSNLEIINGKSAFNGGAIASNSDLAVTRCTIGNSESEAQGGGVFLSGAVGIFTDSLIGFNRAGFRGGGLGLDGASAILTNCTVAGNNVPIYGGGVSLFTADGDQTLTVTNSTIADNSGSDGAGIRIEAFPNLAAEATLRNTLFALNRGPSLNPIAATNATAIITSLGYNMSNDDAAAVLVEDTDRIDTDAQLGDLRDNGGFTQTHALLPGSPALDQGDSSGSSTDQRGRPRPIDDPAIVNATGGDGADIGAFEAALPPATPTPTSTLTASATTTASRTVTSSATATSTATATRSATPSVTGTQVAVGGTATATATRTATSTATPSATLTRTATATVSTPTSTATVSPAVGTPTSTPSGSPVPGSPTPTTTSSPAAGTPTTTPTGSPALTSPTVSPTPTATVPLGACTGDCNRDGQVTISELVLAVNIALGNRPVADCEAADANGNGSVTIEELIAAVRNALGTCG